MTHQCSLVVGLMSGTSADGIDVAVLETDGEGHTVPLGHQTFEYASDLRQRLLDIASQDVSLVEAILLERQLTDLHGDAVLQLVHELRVDRSTIEVVGFHGHTIRHVPEHRLTWQLGNGRRLARMLGIPVVYDFRRADLLAGGQGAPLAPLFHAALLESRPGEQVVLNLGGVANITWRSFDGGIRAGDTGPGCGLLDQWIHRHTGQAYDRDGQWAAAGQVDEDWLHMALGTHVFFSRTLPKSADRFEFSDLDVSHLSVADGAATLCALTAQSVADAIRRWGAPETCWVAGGGVHHPTMMRMLGDRIGNVKSISELGVSPDALEALCFGWMAVRHLRKLPTSLPTTTGASRATVGGSLVTPPQ